MLKLKLGAPLDNKAVKLKIELPARVNRDLIAYADLLVQLYDQGRRVGMVRALNRFTRKDFPACLRR